MLLLLAQGLTRQTQAQAPNAQAQADDALLDDEQLQFTLQRVFAAWTRAAKLHSVGLSEALEAMPANVRESSPEGQACAILLRQLDKQLELWKRVTDKLSAEDDEADDDEAAPPMLDAAFLAELLTLSRAPSDPSQDASLVSAVRELSLRPFLSFVLMAMSDEARLREAMWADMTINQARVVEAAENEDFKKLAKKMLAAAAAGNGSDADPLEAALEKLDSSLRQAEADFAERTVNNSSGSGNQDGGSGGELSALILDQGLHALRAGAREFIQARGREAHSTGDQAQIDHLLSLHKSLGPQRPTSAAGAAAAAVTDPSRLESDVRLAGVVAAGRCGSCCRVLERAVRDVALMESFRIEQGFKQVRRRILRARLRQEHDEAKQAERTFRAKQIVAAQLLSGGGGGGGFYASSTASSSAASTHRQVPFAVGQPLPPHRTAAAAAASPTSRGSSSISNSHSAAAAAAVPAAVPAIPVSLQRRGSAAPLPPLLPNAINS
jgi:hypothetical protein